MSACGQSGAVQCPQYLLAPGVQEACCPQHMTCGNWHGFDPSWVRCVVKEATMKSPPNATTIAATSSTPPTLTVEDFLGIAIACAAVLVVGGLLTGMWWRRRAKRKQVVELQEYPMTTPTPNATKPDYSSHCPSHHPPSAAYGTPAPAYSISEMSSEQPTAELASQVSLTERRPSKPGVNGHIQELEGYSPVTARPQL